MTPVISPWLFYLMNIVDKLFIIEIIMVGVSLGFFGSKYYNVLC